MEGWPEFHLFKPVERLKTVGRAVLKLFSPHTEVSQHRPDHYSLPDNDGEALELAEAVEAALEPEIGRQAINGQLDLEEYFG